MMKNDRVIKAITNMEAVKVRMVEKLASSTTGAQAHIGILTNVESDLAILKGIVEVEVEKPTAPVKVEVPEVKSTKNTKG